MAESNPSKRLREETEQHNDNNPEDVLESETKRHKSFNHILSLLEEEEEEPTQDLSPLMDTLQQELSSDDPFSSSCPNTDPETLNNTELTTTIEDYASSSSSSSSYGFLKEDEDDDKENVMRHLLEASDDELGIPNREDVASNGCEEDKDGFFNGGDGGFPLCCDGLWEFEDVNATYYALLQSELFM